MTTEKLKLGQAVELMRNGRPLMKMHTKFGTSWFVVPGGELTDADAQKIICRNDVQPNSDGLFPGINQTYKITSVHRQRSRAL
jgi:hypothetical protein